MLDLFAGSGALGIEALSRGRGAARRSSTATPRAVARSSQPRGRRRAPTSRADAARVPADRRGRAIRSRLPRPAIPARAAARAGAVGAAVAAVLAPGGLVVSESDRRTPLDLPDLALDDERRYGDTLIRLHATD